MGVWDVSNEKLRNEKRETSAGGNVEVPDLDAWDMKNEKLRNEKMGGRSGISREALSGCKEFGLPSVTHFLTPYPGIWFVKRASKLRQGKTMLQVS